LSKGNTERLYWKILCSIPEEFEVSEGMFALHLVGGLAYSIFLWRFEHRVEAKEKKNL
jgi:hypothetical protein